MLEGGAHLRVVDIQIAAHQVVVVATFQVHVVIEGLALNPPHGLDVRLEAVVIHGVEVPPMPLHGEVGAGAGGVAVVGPGADRALVTEGLEAVLGVVGGGVELLLGISPHQVVEHRIGIDLQAGGAAGSHGRQVLGPGAVLGGHAALLVELAQVVGVVEAVAHVVAAGLALARRRQPQSCDAGCGQIPGLPLQAPPVTAVGRRVPVEGLQQHAIAFRSIRLPSRSDRRGWPPAAPAQLV